MGATVNDMLLLATSGALRRYLIQVKDPCITQVCVPSPRPASLVAERSPNAL
jgi:hypothetical protein